MTSSNVQGPSTLGGRIMRARDAVDFTTAQLARQIGVKIETMKSWETDRSEPRANQLLILSGILGVSPAWLLSGIGDDPTVARVGSALHLIENQLEKLKHQQLQINDTIATIEDEVTRLKRVAIEDG